MTVSQYRAHEIDWDLDEDDEADLPTEVHVEVPDSAEEIEELVADLLAETYGFCVNGFELERLA